MKVLVIGSGGREHALVWKIAQSEHVRELWCASGNAGTVSETLKSNGRIVTNVPLNTEDLGRLAAFAQEHRPDLTVVGPDNPLALGVVDFFQDKGFRIWGPNQRAAQFESSKVFSQQFMERHGIPTARAGTFSEAAKARAFARSLEGRCAVKVDGLALGKGVLICTDLEQANKAIDEILVGKLFGIAGGRIVIQELLTGQEISLHALCDGKTARLFPTAQDHKRALDGDQGLNTGGMGCYAPTPFLSEEELRAMEASILTPWLKGCAEEGIDFRGILYPGVMLTSDGPKVLEFNARFGDPETQVYLPLLETDIVELFEATLDGRLAETEMRWRAQAAVCVVMASGGYPGAYLRGKEIHGLAEAAAVTQTKVFHAGTALVDGKVVSQGGRVLGVTAWGGTLADAQVRAYETVRKITFDGAHYRHDIAAKALGSGAR